MLLALSLAVAFGKAESTFDFDHPPAPVPVIVEALGKELGRNLVADENLAVDILIVHLDDADPDKALQWIAEAIEGEWRTVGEAHRLVRPRSIEIRQEREEALVQVGHFSKRTSAIKVGEALDRQAADLIAGLVKSATPQPGYAIDLPPDLRSRLPMARLAARVIKSFDVSPFIDLPVDTSANLPFDASSFDRRLAKDVSSFVKDYEREDAIYAEALLRRGVDVSDGGWLGEVSPGMWSRGPLKCALQVRNIGGIDLNVALAWGDSGARFVSPSDLYAPSVPPQPVIIDESLRVACELSAVAKGYIALRAPRTFVPKELATIVPLPVVAYFEEDPLFDLFGLGVHDLLKQTALLLGKSFVACLPDASVFAVRRLAGRPNATLQEALGWILNPELVVTRQEERVFIASPLLPLSARTERMSRSAVQTAVKEGRLGRSEVDSYAELVSRMPHSKWPWDPRSIFSTVSRMVYVNEFEKHPLLALRVYGQLTEQQRREAKRNAYVVPWESLSSSQRELWNHVVRAELNVGLPTRQGLFDGSLSGEPATRKAALNETYVTGNSPKAIRIHVTERSVLVGCSSSNPLVSTQIIEGPSLDSMIAHKELGLGGWETDRFVQLPYVEISVELIVQGDVAYPIARYGEAYGLETRDLFGFKDIPSEMISSRRSEIDKVKAMLTGGNNH